ncbi:hypothetical protein X942_5021 [Burkholderia pseudomallei MSHR5596]|nr:hypothetical protein DO63_4597 [Burkholderia pseudomallei]KGS76318.1 hypothetical protein X942_5021 [Burkholderia pseudomallei MSHR5596]
MRPVTGAPRSVIHDPPPATHVLLLADRNLPPWRKRSASDARHGRYRRRSRVLERFPAT